MCSFWKFNFNFWCQYLPSSIWGTEMTEFSNTIFKGCISFISLLSLVFRDEHTVLRRCLYFLAFRNRLWAVHTAHSSLWRLSVRLSSSQDSHLLAGRGFHLPHLCAVSSVLCVHRMSSWIVFLSLHLSTHLASPQSGFTDALAHGLLPLLSSPLLTSEPSLMDTTSIYAVGSC